MIAERGGPVQRAGPVPHALHALRPLTASTLTREVFPVLEDPIVHISRFSLNHLTPSFSHKEAGSWW